MAAQVFNQAEAEQQILITFLALVVTIKGANIVPLVT